MAKKPVQPARAPANPESRQPARSREEAIRRGMNCYSLEEPKKPTISVADLDARIEKVERALRKAASQAAAIKGGYMARPESPSLFLVNPACERGCPDCRMACALATDMPKIWQDELRDLRRERADLAKEETRANIIDFPAAGRKAVRHG